MPVPYDDLQSKTKRSHGGPFLNLLIGVMVTGSFNGTGAPISYYVILWVILVLASVLLWFAPVRE